MSEQRELPALEDLEDVLPDSTGRSHPQLPPLKFVAPVRPHPLEPSTRIDNGNLPISKLDSRPITKPGPLLSQPSFLPSKDHQETFKFVNPADLGGNPRKRQKLDYYQLPVPTSTAPAPAATSSLPTLPPPIPVLNQPPPSAARFPPITPNKPESPDFDFGPILQSDKSGDLTGEPDHAVTVSLSCDGSEKRRRNQLRDRRVWTDQETSDLLKGVKKFGVGKWKAILKHKRFKFQERTGVDLKDRYRTYLNAQRKVENTEVPYFVRGMVRTQSGSSLSSFSSGDEIPARSQKTRTRLLNQEASKSKDQSKVIDVEFEVNTIQDIKATLSHSVKDKGADQGSQKFIRWTEIEDKALIQGFTQYGNSWAKIRQDPNIGLGHKTREQIRDRYRQKYLDRKKPLEAIDGDTFETNTKTSEEDARTNAKMTIDQLLLEDPVEDLNTSFANISHSMDMTFLYHGVETSSTAFTPPQIEESFMISAKTNLDSTSQSRAAGKNGAGNLTVEDVLNDADADTESQLPPLRFPFDKNYSDLAPLVDDRFTLAPLIFGDPLSMWNE